MRTETKTVEEGADTSTDLRLQNALRRRGVALEIAGVMSFSVHETIVDEYFRTMQEDPYDSNYRRVTIQQVHV